MTQHRIAVLIILIASSTFSFSNNKLPRKNAIIIGATSGMGRATAKLLAQDGYKVGLVGRRGELLKSLKKEIESHSFIKQIDVEEVDSAKEKLEGLIKEMGGIDLILITVSAWVDSGTQQEKSERLIKVDVLGFLAMSEIALKHFRKQKSGHLVAISSISGIRGSAANPVYSGVKAFVQKYLEGTRNYMLQNNLPIFVTDIVPGWVDNERFKFSEIPGTYWVVSVEQAASDIFDAIKNKTKVAYVAKRQRLVAYMLQSVPDCIYNWLGGF